jgi:hypothetical protein
LGYSQDVVRIVSDLYPGEGDDPMKVTIRTDHGETEEFPVRRGTIQGDTLSPLLFIIHLEPMLRWLNRGGLGYRTGTSRMRISSPAFADDLPLLTMGVPGMSVQLDKVLRYAEWAGLRLNLPKCAISGINTKGGTGEEIYRNIRVGGKRVPFLSPSKPYKYLGVWLRLDLRWKEQFEKVLTICKAKLGRIQRCSASDVQAMIMVAEVVAPVIAYSCPLRIYDKYMRCKEEITNPNG